MSKALITNYEEKSDGNQTIYVTEWSDGSKSTIIQSAREIQLIVGAVKEPSSF